MILYDKLVAFGWSVKHWTPRDKITFDRWWINHVSPCLRWPDGITFVSWSCLLLLVILDLFWWSCVTCLVTQLWTNTLYHEYCYGNAIHCHNNIIYVIWIIHQMYDFEIANCLWQPIMGWSTWIWNCKILTQNSTRSRAQLETGAISM